MIYVVCVYIVVVVGMAVFLPIHMPEKNKEIKVESKFPGETEGEGMISREHNSISQFKEKR